MWNDHSISFGSPYTMQVPENTLLASDKYHNIGVAKAESSLIQRKQPVKQAYPRYRDFSSCSLEGAKLVLSSTAPKSTRKGTFPTILFNLLMYAEENGHTDTVEWKAHGRAFQVKDKKRFSKWLLPKFFRRQNSYPSFQRQLNVWGFLRLTKEGGYYHEVFLKGRPDLLVLIPRQRYTTGDVRQPFDANSEPDLHKIPWKSNSCSTSNLMPTVVSSQATLKQELGRAPFPGRLGLMTFSKHQCPPGGSAERRAYATPPQEVVFHPDVNQVEESDNSLFKLLALTCPTFTAGFDASQSSSADMEFFEKAVYESANNCSL